MKAIITALLVYIGFLIIYVIYKNRKRIIYNEKNKKMGQDLYDKLIKIPVISADIERIKQKLYFQFNEVEDVLEYKAIVYFTIATFSCILVAAFFIRLYAKDAYMFIVITFVAMFFRGIFINKLIGVSEDILVVFRTFIADVKHYYHRYKRIDEAMNRANKKSEGAMLNHGKAMYEALSKNKDEWRKYFNRCPNRFLKFYIYISALTKEYGDTPIKDVSGVEIGSLYDENLDILLEEVYMETRRKDKLEYNLKFGLITTTVPILIPKCIEIWVEKYLPLIYAFYQSAYAYVIKLFLLLVCIGCYVLIKSYQETEEGRSSFKTREKYWEEYILKFKIIKFLIRKIVPENTEKLEDLIERSGSNLKVEWVYLHKVIAFTISLAVITGAFFAGYTANMQRITNDPTYGVQTQTDQFLTAYSTEDQKEEQDKTVKKDKELMEKLKDVKSSDINSALKGELNVDDATPNEELSQDQVQAKIDLERVQNKIVAINDQHMKLRDIVIILVLSLIFSNVPIWFLKFKKSLREKGMYNEVYQFEAIVSMLKKMDRVSPEQIVKCLRDFADVFKKPLSKCCVSYRSGGKKALEDLNKSVKFPPFNRLVENLIMAEEGNTIEEAFSSLSVDKIHYKEVRRELSDRETEDKIAIGEWLSKIPTGLVFALYGALPTLLFAYDKARQIFESVNNIK